jgi:hypothetical protein
MLNDLFVQFFKLPPHLCTLVYKYSVILIKQVVLNMTKIIKITYF